MADKEWTEEKVRVGDTELVTIKGGKGQTSPAPAWRVGMARMDSVELGAISVRSLASAEFHESIRASQLAMQEQERFALTALDGHQFRVPDADLFFSPFLVCH